MSTMAHIRPMSLLLIVTFCLLTRLQVAASENSTTVLLQIDDFVKDVGPNKEVDLVMIVDRSTGMGIERFVIELNKLAGAILKQYTVIHPTFTRTAVITFGGDSRVIFDYISDKTATKCVVFGGDSPTPWEQVEYIRNDTFAKGTNLRTAFTQANDILTAGRRKRSAAKQIVLLVTDGDFTTKSDPINQVNALKDSKVTIFAVGIGNWLKPGNVRILASKEGYYGSQLQWTDMLMKTKPTSYSTDTPPLWMNDVAEVCKKSCGAHAQCQCDVLRGVTQCMCHTGYYLENGKCLACPSNTYKSELGKQACEQCPPQTESDGTASVALDQCKCPENVTCLDQCEPDPCGSNEVCRRHDASYKCECEKGWSGDNCSTNTDDCLNNGCQNGARCLDMLGDYTCVCKWGFHGRYCELNIDECKQEKDLCRNGATCKDGPNNFNCICTKGWVGRFCQDVDLNLPTTPRSTVPTPVPDVPNPTETTVKIEETTGGRSRFKTTNTPTTTDSEGPSSVTGAIVGAAAGGFLVGVAVCGLVYYYTNKSRNRAAQEDAENAPDIHNMRQLDANITSQTSHAYGHLNSDRRPGVYAGLQLDSPGINNVGDTADTNGYRQLSTDRPRERPNIYASVQHDNMGVESEVDAAVTGGQRQPNAEGTGERTTYVRLLPDSPDVGAAVESGTNRREQQGEDITHERPTLLDESTDAEHEKENPYESINDY